MSAVATSRVEPSVSRRFARPATAWLLLAVILAMFVAFGIVFYSPLTSPALFRAAGGLSAAFVFPFCTFTIVGAVIAMRRPANPVGWLCMGGSAVLAIGSLSSLVGAGKPIAVMFATPALCQTATCGPVLDALLSIRKPYEDRVAFVHIEIYKSNKGVDVAPTVAAWNLPGEPWLFTVDGQGTVKSRLDGAFGRDEMKQALDALVA